MQSISDTYTLHNGIHMPKLGLGVWQTKDGDEVIQAVTSALNNGYRLIDTATLYGNEGGVGTAIAQSSVPREKLFITTKLWNDKQGYDSTLHAFDESLAKLKLDYVDLYLIHWPAPKQNLYIETWKAFETIYASGRAKAIGVSNFQPEHLDELAKHANILPMVNQVELHPYFQQTDVREYANNHNIIVQSWSPIGAGSGLLDDPKLIKIGASHGKSPAQVVIRWHLQSGLAVIPKSVHENRIKQNADVFDFVLSADEMNQIGALDAGKRLGPDPDNAIF